MKELGKIRNELGVHLIGYVVMPKHIHLLIGEPKEGHRRFQDSAAGHFSRGYRVLPTFWGKTFLLLWVQ